MQAEGRRWRTGSRWGKFVDGGRSKQMGGKFVGSADSGRKLQTGRGWDERKMGNPGED